MDAQETRTSTGEPVRSGIAHSHRLRDGKVAVSWLLADADFDGTAGGVDGRDS